MIVFGLKFTKQRLGPGAYVYIHTIFGGVKEYGKCKVPMQFVTPECVTYRELEVEVNEIIKNLEKVKKEAARKFGVSGSRKKGKGSRALRQSTVNA